MRADGLPGANVSISVNRSALHEHASEALTSDHFVTALSWVEAVAGAAFSVDINVESNFDFLKHDLRVDVRLDGAAMRSKVLHHSSGSQRLKIDRIYEATGGQHTMRRFLFAEHHTTDDKPDASLKNKYKHLGEVSVTLTRCHTVGSKPRTQYASSRRAVVETAIPEKVLKGRALSNHVKLGEVEEAHEGRNPLEVTYPYGREPLATYTFKYRSHRDLQIEGIIARSPSPLPLEDRDPQDLTAEEARELVRRMRSRNVPGVKLEPGLKQERSTKRQRTIDLRSEDEQDDVTITSVHPATREKRTKVQHAADMEILDLTGD